MHVHGHGQPIELANEIKPALDLIGRGAPTPSTAPSTAAAKPTLDTAKIAKIVDYEGEQSGTVYKITIGRDDLSVREMGATINTAWASIRGRRSQAPIRTQQLPETSPCWKRR